MGDVLKQTSVSSEVLYDLWVFNLESNRLTLPYQVGFELLNGMLLACKMAMRYEGCSASQWREFAKLKETPPRVTPLNRGFRRSRESANVASWSCAFERQLVVLTFVPVSGGSLTVRFHFSDCFEVYRRARAACKEAKAWAGDSSRQWSGCAHLTDAEENYKYGFNK